MVRYIDAVKLEKEIQQEASESIADAVIRIIDRQPTADVVEVVMCEKCENRDECSKQIHLKAGGYTTIDFCSYGERKGENNVKRNAEKL